MCGFAGVYNFDNRPVLVDDLLAMAEPMFKRGPDSCGYEVKRNAGLCFRRLSIIDLDTGDQPIANEDQTIFLVINGEIYNHRALRKKLEIQGHIFRTKSDSEVLLHLYEAVGEKAFEELNGMFAFAILDTNKHKIIIGRDRFGIKPLYYKKTENTFFFASSPEPIHKLSCSKLSEESAMKYLVLGYVSSNSSFWEGVEKLPPGTFMQIGKNGSNLPEPFWAYTQEKKQDVSDIEIKESLDGLLKRAVDSQLVSDVPVGLFLSGGLDSSVILSYAAELQNRPLNTFTVNFKGKNSQDANFARHLSQRYKTNHTEIFFDQATFLSCWKEAVKMLDEPVGDSAFLPIYLVSKKAREKGVKVLLNGAGGDEVFAGYSRHFPAQLGSKRWFFEGVPKPIKLLIIGCLKILGSDKYWRLQHRSLDWACRVSGANLEILKNISNNKDLFYFVIEGIVSEFESLFDFDLLANDINERLKVDVMTYLPNDVLAVTDKGSMMASVECRVPFLDNDLVTFCKSLPKSVKFCGSEPKSLLKNVVQGRLPDEILFGEKYGFNAPLLDGNVSSIITGGSQIRHSFSERLFDSNHKNDFLNSLPINRSARETAFSICLIEEWLGYQPD